jgi:predicted DCC family thiol-disulfide oxidoreductase YuxK
MAIDGVGMDLRNHLLFDGNCGICTESARYVRTLDTKNLFHVIPYQDVPEDELQRVSLDYKKCDHAVRFVTSKSKVLTGAFAVNYVLFKYQPWSLLVVLIYAIPIFLSTGSSLPTGTASLDGWALMPAA